MTKWDQVKKRAKTFWDSREFKPFEYWDNARKTTRKKTKK